jgi:hypothetical protein
MEIWYASKCEGFLFWMFPSVLIRQMLSASFFLVWFQNKRLLVDLNIPQIAVHHMFNMLQGVTEGFLQIFMVSAEHSRTLNNEFKC